jgi:hypothetical protein
MPKRFLLLCSFLSLALAVGAAELPDLSIIPEDLQVPAVAFGPPAPELRVAETTPGWEGTEVHGMLYLPKNWKPGGRYAVLAEYAGNGGFKNKYGDASEGTVEGSHLGYGLSAGQDYLWICLPYIRVDGARKTNAPLWWGDPDETARYCVATMHWLETTYGGDPAALVLCGFSRGAIGCNYIGLRNDEIAGLWRAFICHSHYDGVRTDWPYSDADRASARSRLERLHGRPQFISQEGSVEATRAYLQETGVAGAFTFADLPFRNHSDRWALRNCDTRRQVRSWLKGLGLPGVE